MKSDQRGILSLLFVMVVWGSSFSVTKVAVEGMPPVLFAVLRFAVASVIMVVLFLARRKRVLSWKDLPHGQLFWMAMTGVCIFYLFFNYSLRYTSASTGALLEGFIPAIIAVLAGVFLKEKLNAKQVLGIAISFGGILLLGSGRNESNHALNPLLGNLLMLVAVCSWAVYTILSKKVAHLDPVLVITYVTVVGMLLLLPLLAVEMYGKSWGMPSFEACLAIIYLGAVASALCYLLYNTALEKLSASQVGNFLNLDPVTGAIIAIVFLHEKVEFRSLCGCALVFTGVWLSTRKAVSQAPSPHAK